MSGRCFSCASDFGFFKKEHGCPSCGFAFCKDCLKKKIAVPRRNQEVHKVCNKCYNILSGTADMTAAKRSPPEALKKRLAALEQKEQHSESASVRATKPVAGAHKCKGMSKEDVALQERLDNLRKDRQKHQHPTPSDKEIEARLKNLRDKEKVQPSDAEMARRLAVLKGQDPDSINQPPVLLNPTVKKSEQQQIDDLLDEICDEVKIDSQGEDPASSMASVTLPKDNKGDEKKPGEDVELHDVNRLMKEVATELEIDAQRAIQGLQQDKELMERLNQLKKDRNNSEQKREKDFAKSSSESSDEDSENEEQAMKRIIKQAFEESKLDQDLQESGVKVAPSSSSQTKGRKTKTTAALPLDNEDSDPDEFPWCCICNEDATLRCLGCDYDLYCNRCFKEGHEQLDMPDHRTVPFRQKSR